MQRKHTFSSISTAVNRKLDIRVTNNAHTPYTTKKNTTVAEFKIMSREEAKELTPLHTAAAKVLTEEYSVNAIIYINELLKTSDSPSPNKNFWFPRKEPDNQGGPTTHHPSKAEYCGKSKN